MNRALLIAVCDFLILSIIAIADFNRGGAENDVVAETAVSVAESLEENLTKILEDERNARMKLEKEMLGTLEKLKHSELNEKDLKQSVERLAKNKQNLETMIKSKDKQIDEKDKLVASQKKTLSEKTAEQKRLQEELKKRSQASKKLNNQVSQLEKDLIAKQRDMLKKQNILKEMEARANQLKLKQQKLQTLLESEKAALASSKSDAIQAQQNNQQLTTKLNDQYLKQQKVIDALNKKLSTLEKENAVTLEQKSNLVEKLQETKQRVKETDFVIGKLNKLEKEIGKSSSNLAVHVDDLFKQNQNQITEKVDQAVVQSEKRISEKVEEVVQQSKAIEKKIVDGQPKSIHELFKNFEGNKVTLEVNYTEKGLFSLRKLKKSIPAILFSMKGKSYALLYYKNSPLGWTSIASNIKSMSMQIQDKRTPVISLNTLKDDPRIVLAELTKKTEGNSYSIADNPRKFEHGLLIDPSTGNYANFPMQFLHKKKGYLHIPAKLSTKLFGKISPRPGTLVVSLDGQLIGMTVSQGMCYMLDHIQFNERFKMTQIGSNSQHKNKVENWKKQILLVEYPRR